MPGVIGRNPYRTGDVQTYMGPEMCDDCDHPARFRMIGETDSFGSEVYYYCAQHMAQHKQHLNEIHQQEQRCDLCGKTTSDCKPWRDPEESYGPQYTVCEQCRIDRAKAAAALLEDEDDILADPDFDPEPEPDDDLPPVPDDDPELDDGDVDDD